jgi:hypothetical protein
VYLTITVQKRTQKRWPSQNTFGIWTVLYCTRSSRTQFGVSINVWRLVGDTLNITCNFLYFNHQVHRDFLIILYIQCNTHRAIHYTEGSDYFPHFKVPFACWSGFRMIIAQYSSLLSKSQQVIVVLKSYFPYPFPAEGRRRRRKPLQSFVILLKRMIEYPQASLFSKRNDMTPSLLIPRIYEQRILVFIHC